MYPRLNPPPVYIVGEEETRDRERIIRFRIVGHDVEKFRIEIMVEAKNDSKPTWLERLFGLKPRFVEPKQGWRYYFGNVSPGCHFPTYDSVEEAEEEIKRIMTRLDHEGKVFQEIENDVE